MPYPSGDLAPLLHGTRQAVLPARDPRPRPAVLLLFDGDWDVPGFARQAGRFDFRRAGFDAFSLPGSLRLLAFDIDRFAASLAVRHGPGIAGVVSHHEACGALAAALVAERLGLPGTAPEAVLACQHKLHARAVLDRVAPEANLRWRALPYGARTAPPDLPFPLCVKPVRSTFSILARRIDDASALQRHRSFGLLERWILRRLLRPFATTVRARLGIGEPVFGMIAEEFCDWPQFNLDGYVHRGRAHLLGVVDEIMYPGTQAFLRFDHPSRLPRELQQRAFDVAVRLLQAVGFEHGFFNLEFFCDVASGAVKVIECNPRLGAQMSDLYLRVAGIDPHGMSLALAVGEDPQREPVQAPRGGAAASFVFRSFGRTPLRQPDRAARARLLAEFPDALLLGFPRRGASLRRELRWLGSHRYGVLHLHGDDARDLRRRYLRACSLLGWPVGP